MRARRRVATAVAFASFIALGLPEAVVGTAWPDMAIDLGRPVADLRWLLVAYTAGYLLSSAPAGSVVIRFGVRVTAAGGVATAIIGHLLYATGPTWPWMVVAALLLGCGAGPLDTAMNVWATTRGPRVMNMLHAFFGIGTTIGPPLTLAAMALSTWRGAYVVLLVVDLILLAAIIAVGPDHRPDPAPRRVAGDRRLGRPAALVVATFAVYVAIESTAGAWGVSYLRDQRGLSTNAAGLVIAGYWAALTVGRMGLALVARAIPPVTVLTIGAAGALIASLLIAASPDVVSVVGFLLLGLFLAGQFPALMLWTPELVGSQRAPLVVGWSLSASGISFGLAAIAVGQQVDRLGLGVIGPDLVIGSLALTVLVVLLRAQRTPDQASRSTDSGSASSEHSSANSSTSRSSGR